MVRPAGLAGPAVGGAGRAAVSRRVFAFCMCRLLQCAGVPLCGMEGHWAVVEGRETTSSHWYVDIPAGEKNWVDLFVNVCVEDYTRHSAVKSGFPASIFQYFLG